MKEQSNTTKEIEELRGMLKNVSEEKLAPIKEAMEILKAVLEVTSKLNIVCYNLKYNKVPWWLPPWLHIQRIYYTKKLKKLAGIK